MFNQVGSYEFPTFEFKSVSKNCNLCVQSGWPGLQFQFVSQELNNASDRCVVAVKKE